MPSMAQEIKKTKAQIELKEKELKEAEKILKLRKKELAKADKTLKELQWQEKLEIVEKELVPLYQKKRGKESKIICEKNHLFNEVSEMLNSISSTHKDLKGLEEKIKKLEEELIQRSDLDTLMREAIEFKKSQVMEVIKVPREIKGVSSLLEQINIADVRGEVPRKDFSRLSRYAQNIYDQVKRVGSKPLKARESELIRLAKISEPRIIKAREVLKENLDKLMAENLIQYEKEADNYIITKGRLAKAI